MDKKKSGAAANFYEISFRYSFSDKTVYPVSRDGKPFAEKKALSAHKALSFVSDEKDRSFLSEIIKSASPSETKVKRICKMKISEEEKWYLILLYFSSENGKPQYIDGKIIDVDSEFAEVPSLKYHAYHDYLTGLYRQNYAKDIILEKLKDMNKNYVFCIFDIDYFKGINDCYGHQFGDKVLQYLSKLAKANLRMDGTDIVARIGGDEFLAFVEYENNAEERVKKFHSSLAGVLDGVEFSVSMGAVDTSIAGRDYDTLYRHADQSLYASKRFGRGVCCFHDPTVKNGYFSNNPFKRK